MQMSKNSSWQSYKLLLNSKSKVYNSRNGIKVFSLPSALTNYNG